MRRAIVAATCLLVGACGGSDADVPAGPVVGMIPDAIEAVEGYYGAQQAYFEISAGLDAVGFIVAVDDATAAEQGSYSTDGGLVEPVRVGAATGTTFGADAATVDADIIFRRIREELDDPVIVDFAIQGGPDGGVIRDATVATDGGGVLLVLLGPDGAILGVQGE